MGRKIGKKRRPAKRGRGKKTSQKRKTLPSDIRTTTVKAELAKHSRASQSNNDPLLKKSTVAASLLTAPSREASYQLLANQSLGHAIASENRKQLPKGPIPIIEKHINENLIEDWKAALPADHPTRLYSGSVLLNPQTSLRSGTY